MKTLRDYIYPDSLRTMLRMENGNIFEAYVTVGEIKDYLIGKILVHPTRLILKAHFSTRSFTFPIDNVDMIDWNYHIIYLTVDYYIWRYKDEQGRFKVYRRDGEGDHLIQQGTH